MGDRGWHYLGSGDGHSTRMIYKELLIIAEICIVKFTLSFGMNIKKNYDNVRFPNPGDAFRTQGIEHELQS